MSIGERIHFFRTRIGMTQKYLGLRAGFSEKTADIRIAQYESETRVPKEDMVNTFAGILGVAPEALTVPNISSFVGIMHTLFMLEDKYGFTPSFEDGVISIKMDGSKSDNAKSLLRDMESWASTYQKYIDGKITKDEYDSYRYTYPEQNTRYHHVRKLPPKLEKELVKSFRKRLK